MLLVIDVGNTNITLGLFDKEEIVANFRLMTKTIRTSDEYGLLICDLLKSRGTDKSDIADVIIASVVPGIMHSLTSGIIKYLNHNPIVIGTGTKTGIRLAVANPKEIGPDRVVDAVGAYEIYGGPVLVIDFGTATTYDLITKDGSFVAGITSPGIRMAANALWNDTARLPEIEIKMPDSVLAKDTVSSMQVGLLYGCIGQTEYIIQKVKEESGLHDLKVVATGGLGKVISDATPMIQEYDPYLTLKGLRLIYLKCKGK
ncbi:MAG: type III pantothenate kinase [Lachnospiraceae bacterium]|nr:type III pantothenate kinase [Lachnospiraceae bacterium]